MCKRLIKSVSFLLLGGLHRKINKQVYVVYIAQDFMEGKLKGFEGEKPTMEDWMNHLGNLYPEVNSYYS